MLTIEKYEVLGWDHVIRGMHNLMGSRKQSDSLFFDAHEGDLRRYYEIDHNDKTFVELGPNDEKLIIYLSDFLRMLTVYVDITAPLYWWEIFDTYAMNMVATVDDTMNANHDHLRTVMLNYKVLMYIYKTHRHRKDDEWRTLCDWIEDLPYSELITGKI